MIEVLEDLQRIRHDAVRFLPLHVANKADATRVVLELRIIQALFLGESVISHYFLVRKGDAFRRNQVGKSTSILTASPASIFQTAWHWQDRLHRPPQTAKTIAWYVSRFSAAAVRGTAL
jgi:hypothetical protein